MTCMTTNFLELEPLGLTLEDLKYFIIIFLKDVKKCVITGKVCQICACAAKFVLLSYYLLK